MRRSGIVVALVGRLPLAAQGTWQIVPTFALFALGLCITRAESTSLPFPLAAIGVPDQ